MVALFPAFVLATALAGSWTETAREGGCVFFKAPAQGKAVPVRAECDWELPAEALHALIAPGDRFDRYMSGVSKSERVAQQPAGAIRVLQVHVFSGVTDRAAFLDYVTTDVPGGKRYAYSKASDQSALPQGYVELGRNEGYWEVIHRGEGAHLVFESAYVAGGYIPGFLVRWLQGAGMRKAVAEVKSAARR
jgi:hypothetical protein